MHYNKDWSLFLKGAGSMHDGLKSFFEYGEKGNYI